MDLDAPAVEARFVSPSSAPAAICPTPGARSAASALFDKSSIFHLPPLSGKSFAMPSLEKLGEFIVWFEEHSSGDEKGQAQSFLDRLFQAFGLGGVFDVGAGTEFRIRKGKEDGGGTAFAELVWKPVVLIEMKKRGVNLQKHYRQSFDYWTRLVPNRPRYVVLCNFDEFWIYDFETDLDTPKDKVLTRNLTQRWGALAFLAGQRPTFEHDREAVTREAADKLAFVFNRLLWRDVPRDDAQRFILQMLVALFAEDIGLIEKYFLGRLLDDCTTPADSYDLISGLFEAMNSRQNPGGRFKGVAYFNGGLFIQPARLELQDTELVALREAAKYDWSKVQPEIFGTLFQHSMGTEKRHAFGAHFTHPADIMKIVGPTIVEPWREQIEDAKTLTRLNQLADRLHHFRVLDPACGSGNFLYIAYRELKRLEARIYLRPDGNRVQERGQEGRAAAPELSQRPEFPRAGHPPFRRRDRQGDDDDRAQARDRRAAHHRTGPAARQFRPKLPHRRRAD
jgi:hypothetical protein